MKRIIILTFHISILFFSRIAAAATYSIEGAAKMALNKNSDILLAREKINEQDERVSMAVSALFPTLDVSLKAYGKQDALVGGSTPQFNGEVFSYYEGALKAKQVLYAGGAVFGAWNSLKKDRDILEAELKQSERDTQYAVIKDFYGLLLAQRKVDSALKSLKIQEGLLSLAEKRFKIGSEKELTVLQIKTVLALLAPRISGAKNNVLIQATEFSNLLGLEDAASIELVGNLNVKIERELLEKQIPSYAELWKERPELKKSTLLMEQVQDTKKIQMAKHFPHVDLVGVWSRSANKKSDLLDSARGNFYAGLELSVPLFSGLSSFSERSFYSSLAAERDISDRKQRDSFRLQRVQASENLNNAQVVLEASEKAFKQAEEALAVATRTYRLGTSTYVQVSDAEKNLTDAELALYEARYNSVLSMADYCVAFAWPLESYIAMLEKTPH